MTTRMAPTAIIALAAAAVLALPGEVRAASSKGCEGGGFSVLGVAGNLVTRIVPAADVGATFLVKGRYLEFSVDADTFGERDWTLTGSANELDLTGGRRTVVYAAKIPSHRGLTLTNDVQVAIDGDALELTRTGSGLSMKIQAKDCANGGVFQMEPARADRTATVFTHVIANDVFYFDNPNFREIGRAHV